MNGVVVQHIISGYHGRVHTWKCQRTDLGTFRSGKLRGVLINGKKCYTTYTKLKRIRMTQPIISEIVQIFWRQG